MRTATKTPKQTKKAKKLTIEERRAINNAMPIGNRYMAAFAKSQGMITINDPAWL